MLRKYFFSVFILSIVILLMYTWLTKNTMTFRQALMKNMYGIIMLPGKLFGTTSAIHYNLTNQQPLAPIYNLSFTAINGNTVSLATYKGKKIVLVNTASNCGYTAQLQELESLHQQYKNKLVIIAFPANDFKNQEAADNQTIQEFCKKNYGVSFVIAAKSQVIKGKLQNPIFHWLSNPKENGWCGYDPVWNFCKYIIDENGVLTHFVKQTVSPLNATFIKAIE